MRISNKVWRKYPRVIPDRERPVGAWIRSERLSGAAEVADLSVGGAELFLAEDLSPELVGHRFQLTLEFYHPRLQRLRLVARICHIETQRLGVVFEAAEPEQLAMLRRYVEQERSEASLRLRLQRLFELISGRDAPASSGNDREPS